MIEIVINVINLAVSTVSKFIYLASFIGQVIVAFFSTVLSSAFHLVKSLICFMQILYEDNNVVFTEEIPNFSSKVVEIYINQVSFLSESVTNMSNEICNKIYTASETATWIIKAFVIVIVEVLLLLKKCLILVGGTFWLIITFIPVHLPVLIRAAWEVTIGFIIKALIDGYMSLLRLTNFLTDVPLQSFIGITSIIVITRLCVHFRENIEVQLTNVYWFIVRKCMYLYHAVYNYVVDSEVRTITSMARDQTVDLDVNTSEVDPGDAADALCVICQERQKNVLTLPCRHVCLCRECCLRLYGYQRTCPICRTFIYHSVNIYL